MTDQMTTTEIVGSQYSLPKSKPLADDALTGVTWHDGILTCPKPSQLVVVVGTGVRAD